MEIKSFKSLYLDIVSETEIKEARFLKKVNTNDKKIQFSFLENKDNILLDKLKMNGINKKVLYNQILPKMADKIKQNGYKTGVYCFEVCNYVSGDGCKFICKYTDNKVLNKSGNVMNDAYIMSIKGMNSKDNSDYRYKI